MLLSLRILVLFCSIPQLVLTSNEQHITITGDDGTTFEQQQYDPSKIHIHAKTNDLHPHDVTIRVHNQNKNQLIPDQYTQQINRGQANVFMQTSPITSQSHPCQEYINDMVSARRERNNMALHLSSLELKIKQLEHANHLLHKQQYSHQQNLRKHTIEHHIIISQDKTKTISSDEPTDITENTRDQREHAKESSSIEDDSTDKEISEEKMKDTIVEKKQDKTTFQWKKNKWSIFIFALLFLIPIIVVIIFFCISKNTNDIPDQNTAFIVDEPVKKNSVQKELPFVLNEPSNVNHYSRQSTNADIQRLSQNLDGYFQNSNVSTKPVISESKNNMEEHNDTKPVISSVDNIKRQSLVEQQMSSSEDDAL